MAIKYLFFSVFIALTISSSTLANEPNKTLKNLAQQYFSAMVASQDPNATTKDLENYLSLLTEDVGHQHLPYQTDGAREVDGKANMRKGMTFYLGVHTEYQARLHNTFIFNDSAIAIRYTHSAKGIHPQNNQPVAYTITMMEVLEIENGKVAFIRKYHE